MKIRGTLKALFIMVGILTLLGGCASNTFVVTKDGKSYFFGSKQEGFYKLLCETGDLQKILADTHLAQESKDKLYTYNCVDRSKDAKEKVREAYVALTPEQRRELRLTFQLHGYDINYMEC
ncbi:MAG: hypothetical protein AB1553_06010 [Nitrospirota bacterium]